MRTHWLWLIVAFSDFGCTSDPKQLLLSSEALSLTKSTLPEKGFQTGEYVTVKRCADDAVPKSQKDKPKTWSALDFLLDKAQTTTKSDYFLKASVYSEGACLTLRAYTAKPL